jgi:hypothetical protein
MALSEIAAVRLKTSDQPKLQREEWESDGVLNEIGLEYRPVLASPAPRVWKNNVLQTDVTDYSVNYDYGIIVLVALPAAGAIYVFEYSSVVFTDAEVQQFIDEASNTTLAAANLLLAWSADSARIARKESLSGGGGFGSMSITTDMRSRELRETAKAYFEMYQKYENTGVAAEGITEIAWTDHMAERMIFNDLLERI